MKGKSDRLRELEQLIAPDSQYPLALSIPYKPEASLGDLLERAEPQVVDGQEALVLGEKDEVAVADDSGRGSGLPGQVRLEKYVAVSVSIVSPGR